MQVSIGYFLSDLGMILWHFPALGGLEYVSAEKHLLEIKFGPQVSLFKVETQFLKDKNNSHKKEEKGKILFVASTGYSYGCFNKFVKLGTLFISGQVEINQLRLSLKIMYTSLPITLISFVPIRFYTMGYPCFQSFSPSLVVKRSFTY